MNLERVTSEHVERMMTWFPDRRSCEIWGGPKFRFPFTRASFFEDTHVGELPSYALLEREELVGFGQYYRRVGRYHVGRLVISPAHRSHGFGAWLIGGLIERARRDFVASECSLFVLADNAPAIRLYEKLGFVRAAYPEDDPDAAPFNYMVAPVERLAPWKLGNESD